MVLLKYFQLETRFPRDRQDIPPVVVDHLAQQLGTNYRSLMYWLRGERPIPAYLLPRICQLLNNFEALDCLESQSGRVAFQIPEPHLTSEKELLAVSHLIREVGEALESGNYS